MNLYLRIIWWIFWILCTIWTFFLLNKEPNITHIPITTAETPIISLQHNTKNCIQKPKISTFMYHYVREIDENDSPGTHNLSVTPENFRSHMQTIHKLAKEWRITLMTGEQVEKAFRDDCFPADNIWIFTSDDWWVDNATNLVPIASEYQIPFILGIISGKLNTHGFMTTEQLKTIAKNPIMYIASHTVYHKSLGHVTMEEEYDEICDSKKHLEAIAERPLDLFIYPSGSIGKHSVRILQECGYVAAWSTHLWKNLDWNNPEKYIMNRIRIEHTTTAEFFQNIAP